jgi:4-amino-4-deoxy-L-arabinose transferase-like glycosyltransferase
MSFLAWGLAMRLLGDTVAGLRALSALIGTATVLTTFLMARELWGRRAAWLAAVLLTFGHFHLHYSRLAVNNVADGLLMTLSLWLVVRGLRSRKAIHFALAGVVIGAGWYGYFGARLIGIVVVAFLAWRAAAEKGFRARYGGLLKVLAGAALVTIAPLVVYYVGHPGALAARSRQVSIFASGWLMREQQITGRGATSLLLEQLLKSISAFNYTLDPTFWYRAQIPLLDPISGGLLVLGLLWTTAHWRRPANGLLLLWLWLAVLFGWVVTENPPSSMRLVIVAPALALLGGLGLNWLIALGRRRLFCRQRVWHGLACVLLCAAAFLNVRYYFVEYTPTRVYGNPTAEVATELGRFLAPCDDGYEVHFYGPPFVYWDFGTLRFLARGCRGVDVPPVGEGEPAVPDLSHGVRFVFLPERLGELEGIRTRYPTGAETFVNSDADGRLLYVLYEVDG